jgi:transcriptional regulator with XRE-family HTH domain
MTIHPQFARGSTETQVLRQQAGRWLRALRERVGLSQKELAAAVGFDYYTFISQLESGRGRLPPGQYIAFSTALQIPLHEFVKTLLRYYDPLTFYALFETEASELDESIPKPIAPDDEAAEEDAVVPVAAEHNVVELAARLTRLEEMLTKLK